MCVVSYAVDNRDQYDDPTPEVEVFPTEEVPILRLPTTN